jgi:peptidoglycan/LPS O-acetylase OafA/YrhL
MHHPILQVVYGTCPSTIVGQAAVGGYLLVVGLPAVLLLTWLFSLAFEKPFMPRRSATKYEVQNGLAPLSLPLQTFTGSKTGAEALADSPTRTNRAPMDVVLIGLAE